MRVRSITRAGPIAGQVKVASSFLGRLVGLMGRGHLEADAGLYLAPCNSIHMFFMRFAIDAIWLGKRTPEGSYPVLRLDRGLRPWFGLVPLVRGAGAVIELPTGVIERSATAVGDLLSLDPDPGAK